ncbi:hypothetical protein [Gemmata sp.]|uniref:hypothetical protein n=1 Tax=Gemmata sp. TaxID=1914242 RepID=UPI003F72AC4D
MPTNPDGTLRPYNPEEIAGWHLGTRGIDDGNNPEEFYSPDGSGCTRLWLCDWNDRFDVIKHLVGEVLVWEDTGGGDPVKRLSRTRPQTHPTFTNWWCVKARITGHKFIEDDVTAGEGNRSPRWDAAEITAQYEMVPFRWQDDAYTYASENGERERYVTNPGHVQAEVTADAQYTTMPGGIMKYKTTDGSPPHNVPVPYPIGYTDCEGKFAAIWRRVPEDQFQPNSPLYKRVYGDPDTGTRPWIGSTNQTPIFGRGIGTCLLIGCEPKLLPDPTGFGYSWDLKWVWFYKPQTHYKLRYWATSGAIENGYYEIAKPAAPYTAIEDLGDDDSLFHLRDHGDGLFKVS